MLTRIRHTHYLFCLSFWHIKSSSLNIPFRLTPDIYCNPLVPLSHKPCHSILLLSENSVLRLDLCCKAFQDRSTLGLHLGSCKLSHSIVSPSGNHVLHLYHLRKAIQDLRTPIHHTNHPCCGLLVVLFHALTIFVKKSKSVAPFSKIQVT